MKKSLFAAAVVALSLVACSKKEEVKAEATVDSTVVDSAANAVVDSAAQVVDSAAAKVEEAAAKVEEAAKEEVKK